MRPRISNQGARMDEVLVLPFNLLKTIKLSDWTGFGNGGSRSCSCSVSEQSSHDCTGISKRSGRVLRVFSRVVPSWNRRVGLEQCVFSV